MNSFDQFFLLLQPWSLGGNQTENDDFVVWNFFQRLKGSGTRVVVFQQKSLGADAPKDLSCEKVIASLQQPPAALITPSEMKPKSDLRTLAHHGVIHFDSRLEPTISTPSLGLVEGLRL